MPNRKISCGSEPAGFPNSSVSCRDCRLAGLCLGEGLDAADFELLDTLLIRRPPVERGELLFRAGEPFQSFFAIRCGSVKSLVRTDQGHEQITGFHFPGELLGLEAIHTGRYGYTAKAIERTGVCEIPYASFEELADRVPRLRTQMLRIMSNEIWYARTLAMAGGNSNAKAQLAGFLLCLAKRFRQRGFSSTEFHLTMSRNDIANYLGVAAETLSRRFAWMQETGILDIDGKHIHVLDVPRLRTIAGLPVDNLAGH